MLDNTQESDKSSKKPNLVGPMEPELHHALGVQGPMESTLKNYTKATYDGNTELDRRALIDRETYLSSLGTSERNKS